VYVDWQLFAHRIHPTAMLWVTAGAVALLPWLSRAIARATYRAKCDDIAIYVRDEALPYKTIKQLRLARSWRRTVLTLERSEDIQLELVLVDAFAGRLEPLAELKTQLKSHGLDFPA
jgi:hypothetical protein